MVEPMGARRDQPASARSERERDDADDAAREDGGRRRDPRLGGERAEHDGWIDRGALFLGRNGAIVTKNARSGSPTTRGLHGFAATLPKAMNHARTTTSDAIACGLRA